MRQVTWTDHRFKSTFLEMLYNQICFLLYLGSYPPRPRIWEISAATLLKTSFVFICLGCYKKKYYTLGALNNKHLFLIVLDARKSKIKAPEDLEPGDSLLPGSQTAVFLLRSWQKG